MVGKEESPLKTTARVVPTWSIAASAKQLIQMDHGQLQFLSQLPRQSRLSAAAAADNDDPFHIPSLIPKRHSHYPWLCRFQSSLKYALN